jgi:hypothetical protein
MWSGFESNKIIRAYERIQKGEAGGEKINNPQQIYKRKSTYWQSCLNVKASFTVACGEEGSLGSSFASSCCVSTGGDISGVGSARRASDNSSSVAARNTVASTFRRSASFA